MTPKPTWNLVSRLGWVLLGLLIAASACHRFFELGRERGADELLKVIQEPELQIMPRRGQGPQLVLMRQRMADKELKKRVKIDVKAFEGVEAKLLSESMWGRLGWMEVISLWQLSNTMDREVEITEAAFTNLPEGFSLKSDYHDEPVIRLQPKS